MAITADTPQNLVVGAGEALVDHANLGATVDANAFRIERTIFTPDLNGAKGALKGTDYVTSSEGILEMSIPEFNADILAKMWAGSKTDNPAVVAGMAIIDEDTARRIPTADYHDWELQVERLNGGEFQFEVDNAINVANIEASLADDALAAPRVEAHGRWDADPTSRSPHRIRILDVAS
jgi:hypothetical protein